MGGATRSLLCARRSRRKWGRNSRTALSGSRRRAPSACERKIPLCRRGEALCPGPDGCEYHDPSIVERDFAQMRQQGINAVRTYTQPPGWLLDKAWQSGLRVLVGLAWEQHVAFLQDLQRARDIEQRVRKGVRSCAGHPAVLGYTVGNEIPAPMVRWYGHRKVEGYIERLYWAAREEDPDRLVTYVNYPSTEYLELPFLDLVAFNVYLESPERWRAYLARLQNLAGDRPLLMTEIGLDSLRHGEAAQARGRSQAELPILDVLTATVPLVSPGKNEQPGTPGGERALGLPLQHAGLGGLAVAEAVQADFRHQQRAVTSQVLEPGEVGAPALRRLEVHVKGDQIEEGQFQVFGGGIVDVGHQAVRVFLSGRPIEAFYVALYLAVAIPANHRRRNLVSHRIAEHSRMSGAAPHALADALLDVPGTLEILEEGNVLLPRQAHEHPQAALPRFVEQPTRRLRVCANGVYALLPHLREVPLHNTRVVILAAVRSRTKRAVGHADRKSVV